MKGTVATATVSSRLFVSAKLSALLPLGETRYPPVVRLLILLNLIAAHLIRVFCPWNSGGVDIGHRSAVSVDFH